MSNLTQEELFGLRRVRDCGSVLVKRGPASTAMYGRLLRRDLISAEVWHRNSSYILLRYVTAAERKALAA